MASISIRGEQEFINKFCFVASFRKDRNTLRMHTGQELDCNAGVATCQRLPESNDLFYNRESDKKPRVPGRTFP